MSTANPALSVIVLAYRNDDTVVAAVRSLLGQSSPEPFEVILVVSGGSRAAELLRERHPEVRVIESFHRLLPGAARNRGIAAAHGDIVAFLAGDCVAEPGWVERRIASHRSGHAVVASAVTNSPPTSPSGWGFYYTQFCTRLPGRNPGLVVPPDGAAHGLSYDRGLLGTLGPFPEDIRTGEDTVMAFRVAEAGERIWYEPSIRTAHQGPRHMATMVEEQFARGRRRAAALGRRWEDARAARFVWRLLLSAFSRLSWSVRTSWRNAGPERRRVALALPWMALSSLANQAGWMTEQLGMRRPGYAPPETQLPTPRSWQRDRPLLRRLYQAARRRLIRAPWYAWLYTQRFIDVAPSGYRREIPPLRRDYGDHEHLFEASESTFRSLLRPYQREIRWPPHRVFNGWFETVDAELYYSFVRRFRPGQIIEIGSGNSTRFAVEALTRNRHGRILSIDPEPRRSLPGGVAHIAARIEQVDPTVFRQLEEGDVLFIDSSHMTEEASYHVEHVLPLLRPGVLIHHHDVFFPYEYFPGDDPAVYGESEVLLDHYLANRAAYEILVCASYVQFRHPELLRQLVPSYRWAPAWYKWAPSRIPHSLWTRKLG